MIGRGSIAAGAIAGASGAVGVALAITGAPRAAGGALIWGVIFAYLAVEVTEESNHE